MNHSLLFQFVQIQHAQKIDLHAHIIISYALALPAGNVLFVEVKWEAVNAA